VISVDNSVVGQILKEHAKDKHALIVTREQALGLAQEE